jgi:hypothetical protein
MNPRVVSVGWRIKTMNRWAMVTFLFWAAFGENCWGQFRVPIAPRIPVVPRPVPIPHHVPIHGPSANRGVPDRKDGAEDSATAFTASAWAVVAVLVAGVGGLIAYVLSRKKRRPAPRIRIIATPPGEAPESVRRAWIGLELSLVPGSTESPEAISAAGVLSGETGGTCLGFVVEGREAITALGFHDPVAAAWWRENVPEITSEWYGLGFPAGVCELKRPSDERDQRDIYDTIPTRQRGS